MELAATGETARRRGDASARLDLTPQELRVALAVAEGSSNREAAAALFLSTKTVESHLASVYRKLDINSRTLLVEVDLDNRKGELTPGAYTEVHLKVGRPVSTVVIPVSTLLFRKYREPFVVPAKV